MGNYNSVQGFMNEEDLKERVRLLFKNVSTFSFTDKQQVRQVRTLVRQFTEEIVNCNLSFFKKYIDTYLEGLAVGITAKLISYNFSDENLQETNIAEFLTYLAHIRNVHASDD